ncbi:hypothetical protein RHMOL_Rhmol10G0102500 [Rhododendron molle]|uniref:Uncharacterized protein n=1 Tax=Rhododendron molle TaxID=49168 RepID=A0ACC0M0W9_RHOML|nr:hypothetical protein RHMOL_Rhmol10G0102500 [Rhododendron molle]
MDLPNLYPENPLLSSTPSLLTSTPLFSPSPIPFPGTTDLRNVGIHESSLEFDGDDDESILGMSCDDYPMEEVPNLEDVWEPKVGMSFDSEDEAHKYYASFAKAQGFGVITRSSRKRDDGRKGYVTYCCHKGGKTRTKALNPIKAHPTAETGCKASMNITLHTDGKWIMSTIELEHNHEMCPDKARYLKFYRVIPEYTKRMMEFNRLAGIKMSQTISSCVIEAKGHENMTFLAKDARNYMDQVRRSELKEGDAEAMHKYFKRMQANNGVNHHGQSILLGCGLILREDTSSFVWLFETWLACMSGCSPNAIITDQCKAMQNAISIVFLNARHRWCLWHILKKIPVKLNTYEAYESIKSSLRNVVFDSLSVGEFEENWKNMIHTYQLGDNQWLSGLYEERHRWVPAFVKDIFWAGMSTTQRSESMNAFFDGYVHSKTTLKEFVSQYENALRSKVLKEEKEDARSFNVQVKNVSPYGFENQFQEAYTIGKCKDFRTQLAGKITCTLISVKTMDGICEFEIEGDIKCAKLNRVPEKYVLRRWRKNVMRSHTNVKISYVNRERKPEWRRFDMMMAAFHEAADNATYSDAKSARVVAKLREAKAENEVCDDECPIPPMPIDVQDSSVSPKDKQKPIGDPNKPRRRGRPPINRKQPRIEKIIKKIRESSNKIQCRRGNANNRLMSSGSHIGTWSYDLNETPINLEN